MNNLQVYIVAHLQGSGPVSFPSIMRWIEDQYTGTDNNALDVGRALDDLISRGVAEKYDAIDGYFDMATNWTTGQS